MKTKLTKSEFINDVIKEIKSLKKHATREELERLDFEAFSYSFVTDCIYGQMTGNCKSYRAKDLMDKSCVRVMSLPDGCGDIEDKTFAEVNNEHFINGDYNKQTWIDEGRDWCYLSALEGYICLKNAKTKNIINYLKGETNTLNL